MANFQPSDVVVLMRAVSEPIKKGIQGIVTAIVESRDRTAEKFAMYEVRFPFGTAILYGTQIEHAPSATAAKIKSNLVGGVGRVRAPHTTSHYLQKSRSNIRDNPTRRRARPLLL
jgi:hypothetical protein